MATKCPVAVDLRFKSGAKNDLESPVKSSIHNFFEFADTTAFGCITFTGVSVNSSGDPKKILKSTPGFQNPGMIKGFPISVWVEGRQGIQGFLKCEHESALPALQELVLSGKPKKEKTKTLAKPEPEVVDSNSATSASADVTALMDQHTKALEMVPASEEKPREVVTPPPVTVIRRRRITLVDKRAIPSPQNVPHPEVRPPTRKQTELKAEPSNSQQLERFVVDGLVADDELIGVAGKFFEAKRVAEEELLKAREHETHFEREIARLQASLQDAETSYAEAAIATASANVKVAQFTLSDDMVEKIREAKRRIDTLMTNLNLTM